MVIGGIRPGMAIIYDNNLYLVVKAEHSRQARGSAFCRTKLKDLNNGKVLEKTLRDSDKVEKAFIDKNKIEYTYRDGDIIHFMDMQTYEDIEIPLENIEEQMKFLKENTEVTGQFYDGKMISLELPPSVTLKVTYSEPGVRGDTAKQVTKAATLETGAEVQVPLFVNIDDEIVVNPETGEYLSRA